MGSVPDARRARLTALTAAALVAAVALGSTAAGGRSGHGGASHVASETSLDGVDRTTAPGYGSAQFFDAASLLDSSAQLDPAAQLDPQAQLDNAARQLDAAARRAGAGKPDAAAPADDVAMPGRGLGALVPGPDRAIPQASRALRAERAPVIPEPAVPDPECRLNLGYGTWKLDMIAARALTMYTAVAYREGMLFTKPARSFQRHMHTDGRTAPTPVEAEASLRKQYKGKPPVPKRVYQDAVYALYRPHALMCKVPQRQMPWQAMLTNGLTFRSQDMLFAWWEAYGGRPVGGFSPEGITTGHIEDSAHYEGRAVDISFPLSDKANKARGWLLAHWLVANADYYQIATIIWDGLIWGNWRSEEGWRKYHHPWGDTKSPTLNHLDHIHVDVVRGWSEDMPKDKDEKAAGKEGKAKARTAPKTDSHVGGSD